MQAIRQMCSVSPLVNSMSQPAGFVRHNASRHVIEHVESDVATRKGRSAAYALGGLSLNALGAIGAATLLPAMSPAALGGARVFSLLVPGAVNYALTCGPGAIGQSAPHDKWSESALRHVAWVCSHVAMGMSVGLIATPILCMTATKLAIGIVIGVGIPVGVYFFELCKGPRATNHVDAVDLQPTSFFSTTEPALQMDSGREPAARLSNALGFNALAYSRIFATSWSDMVSANIVGTSFLCLGSTYSSLRRAQNLGQQADQIDPASSSLLLSSAVMTSLIWGLQAAAIRYGAAWSVLRHQHCPATTGYGLDRSASVSPA